MIYKIHSDEHYLIHEVPLIEALNTLGEEHGTLTCNPAPKEYKDVWKTLNIEFKPWIKKAQGIADMSENYGRLFLNEKAYDALQGMLKSCGEFLPVNYEQGSKGYLFNPLSTAEELNAIDKKLLAYDEHGNLSSYAFHESKVNSTIFKTELDSYLGVFCTQAFKEAYENHGLTGLLFNSDVSNPINEAYGTKQ